MTDPVCISPSVRLLRVCEERQHGTLENIDALLGKTIVLNVHYHKGFPFV